MSTTTRVATAPLLVLAGFGCQGRLATYNYTAGFEGPILRMYETHVLANLVRRSRGEFAVQMVFSGFASNVTYGANSSGEFQIFDTQSAKQETNKTTIAFNPAFWSITPTVGSSVSGQAGFVANPSPWQAEILALYDTEVARDPWDRIFRFTTSPAAAAKGHCCLQLGLADWAYVPAEKTREFCDFVSRVSFYKSPTPPATQPGPESTADSAG